MWPAEAGVSRFGPPDNFGPPHPQEEAFMDPRYMIYDERHCYMPPGIAQRNPRPTSPSAINEADQASRTLSHLLRHGDRRIDPFNEG
eukprot:20440-Heterocapsa_arctica.AAC.1